MSVKGIVHPKINIRPSFTYPSFCFKRLWVSFFRWTPKEIFWRMLVTRQLTVDIILHRTKKKLGSLNIRQYYWIECTDTIAWLNWADMMTLLFSPELIELTIDEVDEGNW